MTTEVAEALFQFWNSFGLEFYTTNNVPSSSVLPYGTYDLTIGKTLSSAPLSGRLWYEGTLPRAMFQKADEIHERIKDGYHIPCGNGYLVLYPGEPFAQPVADEDDRISTLYLNVTATYILK